MRRWWRTWAGGKGGMAVRTGGTDGSWRRKERGAKRQEERVRDVERPRTSYETRGRPEDHAFFSLDYIISDGEAYKSSAFPNCIRHAAELPGKKSRMTAQCMLRTKEEHDGGEAIFLV